MNVISIKTWMLALSFFLMIPAVLKAQNYVEAEDYLEKTTTVQYYDGIGRPTSLSIKGLNTSGKSVCSFAVNEMGAATYSLPIEMPASGGFEPHISIVYNSQSSNCGIFGYGFGISGISVITRTGHNPFTDGVKRGVSYTPSDNYSLDGKRLILKSGTPGQEGAIYTVEGNPYTLVYIHGSYNNTSASTWFEVKAPDGSVYAYGKTDNSRLCYKNGKGHARIASWYIAEAQDKYSNSITYSYTKRDEMLHLYPSAITYGTNKYLSRGIINRDCRLILSVVDA